jgi:hypothetical protein
LIALRSRSEGRYPEELASRPSGSRDPLEQGGVQAPDFRGRTLRGPVGPKALADRGPGLGLGRIGQAEVEGAPDVRAFDTDALECLDLPRVAGTGDVCELDDPVSVACPEDRLTTRLPKPVVAELPKRFEEPEPVAGVSLSSLQDRLLDERAHDPGNLLGFQPVAGTDRLSRIELEPTREHREAGPQRSLVLTQELVAPVDRRLERLLAEGHTAVPRTQRVEPGAEPTIKGVQAKGVEPHRCQLERERDAVDMRADAQDGGGVRGVHGEALPDGTRALHEQGYGVRSEEGLRRRISIAWQRQGGHIDHDLPSDPERLPTRGEDPQIGTGAQQRSDQDGRGVVDVLAVVQDQERPFVREIVAERGERPGR